MAEEMGEGRAVLQAVEDERVVATFAIYFSRATGSKSNDHLGLDAAEKPAGTGRVVFPRGREKPSLRRRQARARRDFKTINHRSYTPRG